MASGIRMALDLLREIDIKRIHAAAEQPGVVLIVGDGSPAEALASLVTRDAPADARGLYTRSLGMAGAGRPGLSGVGLALLAADQDGLDDRAREWVRGLRVERVPTIAVRFGSARTDGSDGSARMDGWAGVPLVELPHGALGSELEEALATALEAAMPEDLDAMLALARRLPMLRRAFTRRLVEDTARANAWYALSTGVAQLTGVGNLPLALADMVVLSKNQLIMAYKIALAAGRQDRPPVLLGQVVGVIGAGLMFRQIARELVGLLPVVGLLPKVAVAYAGTRLIGAVVEGWALDGRTVPIGELRMLFDETMIAGRRVAEELRRSLPGPHAS